MKSRKHIWLILLFISVSFNAFCTHIAGGSLSYVYNGGNSYTFTLVLYRDCCPTCAAYPGNVGLTILNGDGSNSGINLTLNPGTATNLPDSLPPCAVAPNPLPCIQERFYTGNVTLPLNPGGYHIYYSLCCRNSAIVNIQNPLSTGEDFYANVPGPYTIDFNLPNGTTTGNDSSGTGWTNTLGATPPNYAKVNNGVFDVSGANGATDTWTSTVIPISSYTAGVTLSALLSETGGGFTNADSLQIYYSLNGGPKIHFNTNGTEVSGFGTKTATTTTLVGNTIQIFATFKFHNPSGAGKIYGLDNVSVIPVQWNYTSSPVFGVAPPLFICEGTPFTTNYSATEPDGDSLVYSFYTPSDGNGPTVANNIATYQPVSWIAGYSAQSAFNPGGPALSLDPSTGILSGTANSLGIFVVGVQVSAYKKGVLQDAVVRDFQFNVVTCPQQLGLAFSTSPANPVICFGQTTTVVSAIGTGGIPPYTYLWNNSVTGSTVNVGQGTYTVELNDATNCNPVFGTVTVTEYTVATTAKTQGTETVCSQNPTTVLTGTVTGTASTTWTGGAGTFTPNNTSLNATYTPTAGELAAGHVNLVLTASVPSCPSATSTLTVKYQGFLGTPSIAENNVSCFGLGNGSATASVAGGDSPYTYFWSNSQTTATISGLAPGTYSVTITDAIGCTDEISTTVNQPAPLSLGSVITNVACSGAPTGSIVVTPSGGTSAYTYLWKPGNQTTAAITGQVAGTYSVSVTDAKSCTTTAAYTITQPATLSVTTTSTNVSCFNGNNGTITTSVAGGTSPYSYNWSSGATSPNLTGLQAGTYTLTVTDFHNCSTTSVVTITQPAQLTVSTTQTNQTCSYLTNGTVTATGTGGTAGYTYLWQGGQTTATITGLSSGTYTVTATDSKGCTAKTTATITQPPLLTVNFINQVNVSCKGGNNGTVTATSAGGTAGYTYSWQPGGQTIATINGLTAGTYSVTSTDANGCTAVNSVVITQPTQLTVSTTQTNQTCSYLNNGTATATAANGTAGYTYLWQPTGATTATVSNLSSGTYTVTTTDSKGCTASITATITKPTTLVVNFPSETNVSCKTGNDGTATALASGGTAGYSYVWQAGGQTTASITGLSAGTYTAIATDANGCVGSNTVTITQPTQLTVSTTETNQTCSYLSNGTATAVATNGTAGYTYLWQGGQTTATITGLSTGTYTVTATDSKGCTAKSTATITQPPLLTIGFTAQTNVSCKGGNNGAVTATSAGGTANYSYSWQPGGQSTATVSGLTAGTYTVTSTDANGCTATNTVTITEPTLLTVSTTQTNQTCSYLNNGTATATAANGTAGYTYLWQPTGATTATVSNLSSGTYTVTTNDSKGCIASTMVTITKPAVLVVNFPSKTNVSCKGGSDGTVTALASGGTAGYSYVWQAGGQTTASITGLSAGTYTATATDANGCTGANTVSITQPTQLTVSTTETNQTCSYLSNGTATATAANGTAGYTYLWQGGQATATITGLSTGTYTVTATDSKGCTAKTTATITQPPLLTVGFTAQTNVSCKGGNNGAVTATSAGGTANYSYSWQPGGQSTATVSGLTAGTYTATSTDANGCTATNTVTITEPALLTVSTTQTNQTCSYLNNGTATATASGGTSGYTYLWQPMGTTTTTVTNLSTGTYTVITTDSKGCIASTIVTITKPAVLVVNFPSKTNVSCKGGSDGTVTALASGGNAGYSYVWQAGGQTTATATGLSAGTYTATATDANGCTGFNTVTITQPTQLTVSTTETNQTCSYLSNGTATATAANGTAGYTYLWQGGQTTATITGLSTGTYTVTATDSKGCTAKTTATIIQPPLLTVGFIAQTNVSCKGGNNGAVTATSAGGTANYSYSWQPGGQSTATISGLTAGTYTATSTDANGCTATNTVTITEPTLLTVSTTQTNQTCSYSNNGTATATASGGTSGYTYLWQPMGTTTATVTNLSTGTYTVITTDNKSCTASTTVTITKPAVLVVNFPSETNVSCKGGSDGTATALASGGTAGYGYVWQAGGQTTATATGLSAGTYTVTTTDANGCTGFNTVTITQPTQLTVSTTETNQTCSYLSNGTATATAANGTAGYTYLWQGGQTTATISGLSTGTYTVTATDSKGCTAKTTATISQPSVLTVGFINRVNVSCKGGNNGVVTATSTGGTANYSYSWQPGGQSTASLTGLTAGTYTVTSTDANGCITINTVTITEPPLLTVSITPTPATCHNSSDGSAIATPTGGTGPYQYVWLPGDFTSQNISGLSAQTYSVTVTDENGCEAANSAIVSQPSPIVLIITTVDTKCSLPTGKASIVASGGAGPPYTYDWSTGATTNAITNLFSGLYSVVVTDPAGCIESSSGNVSDSTAALITLKSSINVSCYNGSNGSISLSLVGEAPYTFNWSNGISADSVASNLTSGVYTVTVTAANNCKSFFLDEISQPQALSTIINTTEVSCNGGSNGTASATSFGGVSAYTYLWLPGATTGTSVNDLSEGTYTVQTTDANNCVQQTTYTITQPAILTVGVSSTNVLCNGESDGGVSAIAGGGTVPYSYTWMPGSVGGQNLTDLPAGNYTVTAMDYNSCVATNTVTISQPTAIGLVMDSINSNCSLANGQASVVATGGTGTYTYQWSPTGGTNATATGLLAGSYSVTVTDGNGCVKTASTAVNDNPSPSAGVNTTTNVSCNGGSDATATVTVTSGTVPFTYIWSPIGGTNATATGLSAGSYTVVVTDKNGCTSNAAVSPTITQPFAITTEVTVTNVSCKGGNNGTASVTSFGGTPGFSYIWLPGGSTGSSIGGLIAGSYTVQTMDANNCVETSTYTITEPALLAVAVSSTTVLCSGKSDGGVSAIASGGTSPYSYTWTPGNQIGPDLSNLPAGSYTVTVTDLKSCMVTNTVIVTQPIAINLVMDSINSNCSLANGQASVVATGGIGTYMYQWSPTGGTNAAATGLLARSYSVTVTDGNGCVKTASTTVHDNPNPSASVNSTTNVSCNGGSDATATVTVTSGTAPFTYVWSPTGGTNATATGLSAGSYTIVVTDKNGCTSNAAVSPTITQPFAITTVITVTNVSCKGGNDGTASVTSFGGTPGFSYIWLPGGSTGSSIGGLIAGSYTVQTMDANNCVETSTYTITEPALLAVAVSSTTVLCSGKSDGGVSAIASGGTSPYSYIWTPGNIVGQNLTNLPAGTYTVTVTDVKSCMVTNTVIITQPTPIVLVTDSINSNCSLANGQASVVATGGIGTYMYQWSPTGGTNAAATGLLAGSYSVTVTDGNGCVKTASTTVHDNPSPSASVNSTTNVSCNGGSDATATVTVTSGTAPFTYVWSPTGGTNATATGLSAGSYTIVVTDKNGCTSNAAVSPTITQPFAITTVITVTNVSCKGGNDGSASITSFGGTPGFSYIWLPGGSTGSSIGGLIAGSYTVQTTDANNCVQTSTYTITEPALLAVAVSSTTVLCSGKSDGGVSAIASGGTSPYSYIWTPGNIVGQNLTNLPAGTYTVTVTDVKSCMVTNTVTIIQPTPIVLVMDSINSNCSLANGQASVVATGGIGTYMYQWSPTGGTNVAATGLLARSYSVTVTDGNGCVKTASTKVNDNPSPSASVNSTTNVSCNGGSDGTATVAVTSGTAPFTYVWSPIGGTNATATGLSAGTYTVVVTDKNGCTSNAAVSPKVTDPIAIVTEIAVTNVSCKGGSNGTALATSFGGTPGFTYLWLSGSTTGSSITGLSVGNYTVQTMDSKNCVITDTFSITEPTLLTATISSVQNISCKGGNDGNATVTVGGGTPDYNYNWIPSGGNGPTEAGLTAGSYTVMITDVNNCLASQTVTITEPTQSLSATSAGGSVSCNGGSDATATINPLGGTPPYYYQWSPSGGSGQSASGLSAQTYEVVVTDSKNCQTTLFVTITQPPSLVGNLVSIDPSCGLPNGVITAQISGGTEPYSYLWAPGGATGNVLKGAAPGTYTVQVTDIKNCQILLVSSTLVNIPSPVVSVSSQTNVACFEENTGACVISISKGTAPFAINWMPYGGNGLTASSLTAGTYTANVTDALGCVSDTTVTITQPSPVSITLESVINVLCFGNNTGNITILASGGTPPYTYLWTNTTATSSTAGSLKSGLYTVQVTDHNNCQTSISQDITQPSAALSSTVTTTAPVCFGLNGSASVTTSGGTMGYRYSWSSIPVQTGASATLFAGIYKLTTIDNFGCTTINNFNINEPSKVVTHAVPHDTICKGKTAVITATASGGSGGWYYAWEPAGVINSGSYTVSPNINTAYSVAAYDNNGCPGNVDSVKVAVLSLSNTDIQIFGKSPICPNHSSDISVQASSITGPSTLTYKWNPNIGNGAGPYIVSPTKNTTYTVTVTDTVCGNSVTDSVQIDVTTQPTINITSDTNKLCTPGTVQFFDNSVAGNIKDPVTNWNWNFGDGFTSTAQNPSHNYTIPGTHDVTLTVSTAGGCTSNNNTAPLVVNAYSPPVANFAVLKTTINLPYDSLKIKDQSTSLTADPTLLYNWSFGDGGTYTGYAPRYLYKTVGSYQIQLTVTSTLSGCMDTVSKYVTTNVDVVFPNAFTPSAYGPSGGFYSMSDVRSIDYIFFPFTSGVVDYKLEIFNRWGELIFVSTNVNQGWDGYYHGQLCEQDVYVWKAYVKLNNGNVFVKTGDVTLLQ